MFDTEEKLVLAARRWKAALDGGHRVHIEHAADALFRATVAYERWAKLRPLKAWPKGSADK